jgi:hypothetical protein
MFTVLEPINYDLNGTSLTLMPGIFAAVPLEAKYIGGIDSIIAYILRPSEADWPSYPVANTQLEDWIGEGRVARGRPISSPGPGTATDRNGLSG